MEEANEARDALEPEETGIGRAEKIGIIAVGVLAVLSLAFLVAVLTVMARGNGRVPRVGGNSGLARPT